MRLNELTPAPGSRKRRKRVGRGHGSGHGKTSGRGHKGQKARSGSSIPAWFEGGQMPLQRRLPKRGFVNPFRKDIRAINVSALNVFEAGTVVDPEVLLKRRLVRKPGDGIKILGKGELTKALTVRAHAFSEGARQKIEAAGGTAEVC